MRVFARAAETHDWDPVLALCAPALVEHDHRPLAVLGTTRGAEAWVQNFRVLVELAPDTLYRVDHFRSDARGFCSVGVWEGSREGGRYELPLVAVLELDEQKRIARADIYDGDQLDQARARFDELRPDPLRVPPNAASRAIDRVWELAAAGDTSTLRTLVADDFCFDDREKRALVRGSVEDWQRSLHFLVGEARGRIETCLVATAGERLALHHVRWREAPGEGRFEIEGLRLAEIDAAGRFRTFILFDTDQRATASEELFDRFASGEAAGCGALQAFAAFFRALKNRSIGAMRESLRPEFVMSDHRSLGLGDLDRDLYVASLQASVGLSVGLSHEAFRVFAWNESGLVVAIRRFGTTPDGGGPFEDTFVALFLTAQQRVARLELFGETDAERAVARFAELCPAIRS